MSDTTSLLQHLNENIEQIKKSDNLSIYNCFCPPIVYLAKKGKLNLDNGNYNPLDPSCPQDPLSLLQRYFEALGRIADNIEVSPFETLWGCFDLLKLLGLEKYNDFLNFRGIFKDCDFFKVRDNWYPFGIRIPAIIARMKDLQFDDDNQTNLIKEFRIELLLVAKNRRPKDLLIQAFSSVIDYLHHPTKDMPEFGFPNPFVEAAQGKISEETQQNAEEISKKPELVIKETRTAIGSHNGKEEKRPGIEGKTFIYSDTLKPKLSDYLTAKSGMVQRALIYPKERKQFQRDLHNNFSFISYPILEIRNRHTGKSTGKLAIKHNADQFSKAGRLIMKIRGYLAADRNKK